jgi:hypothetical protein
MSKGTGSRKRESRYDIDVSRAEDSLGGLFKELNHLIRQADKSKRKNDSELSLTGEIIGLVPKRDRLIYGFSIELEKGAKK